MGDVDTASMEADSCPVVAFSLSFKMVGRMKSCDGLAVLVHSSITHNRLFLGLAIIMSMITVLVVVDTGKEYICQKYLMSIQSLE